MNEQYYTNKNVIITGSGGVLGSEFCKTFAQMGANVAMLDLNEKAILALEKELKDNNLNVKAYTCDVLNKDSLVQVHHQIKQDFGSCDILINGAGGNNPVATTDIEFANEKILSGQRDFFNLDQKGIEFVFSLNYLGTLLPTQILAQDMVQKKSGNIINISSMNAFTPLTKISAYSGAKAAISNLTQWMAVYFAKK